MFHNLPAELSLFCPDQEVPELRGHNTATIAPSHHPPMGQGDQYPAWTQEKYVSYTLLAQGSSFLTLIGSKGSWVEY